MVYEDGGAAMKFLHISDLHIGKTVNDFSMLEDQKWILDQIDGMAAANGVDAVVIAGDLYDRTVPPGEAVTLFDRFLTGLVRRNIQVIMISGNHDSPERISYGGSLLHASGVHVAGMMRESLMRIRAGEGKEDTEFVLLPFVRSAAAGAANSNEAVKKLLSGYWEEEKQAQKGKLPHKNRVLVTHFFVTDAGKEPELSDSETTIHVGGIDNVDASLFDGFDYVALGHIHKMQRIGERPVWYAGAPLKYSFGEAGQTKCALLVTMGEKGLEEVRALPLNPRRNFRKIEGSLSGLLKRGQSGGDERFDYIQAILTDQGELIDPIGTLRSVYPNIMQIVREEKTALSLMEKTERKAADPIKRTDAVTLFEDFYRQVRDEELPKAGREVVTEIVKELQGS